MRALWTLAAGLALSPGAALACALELILAVDVSGSINREEFALQTEGMAVAFENPQLVEAVLRQEGGVLATVTQWSGASRQRQITGWHKLTGPDSMKAFADEIRHYTEERIDLVCSGLWSGGPLERTEVLDLAAQTWTG